MNIALWDQLEFYTRKVDIERNKAFRNRFQFVGNSCEKDSWAILLFQDNASNDALSSSNPTVANPVNELVDNGNEPEPEDDEQQRAGDYEEEGEENSEEEEEDEDNEEEDEEASDYEEGGRKKSHRFHRRKMPGPKRGPKAVISRVNGQVACPTCSKLFKTMGELKQHEPFHTRIRSFICAVCQKSFLYASSYYAHKRRHVTVGSRMPRSLSTSPDDSTSPAASRPPTSHSNRGRPRAFRDNFHQH